MFSDAYHDWANQLESLVKSSLEVVDTLCWWRATGHRRPALELALVAEAWGSKHRGLLRKVASAFKPSSTTRET